MTEQLIKYWNLQETNRTNLVREAETERNNRANVALGYAQMEAQQRYNQQYLAELERHNRAMEVTQDITAGAKVGDAAARVFSIFTPSIIRSAPKVTQVAGSVVGAGVSKAAAAASAVDTAIMSGLSAGAVPFAMVSAPLATAGSVALMTTATAKALDPYTWNPGVIVDKKKAGDYSSVTYADGSTREIYSLTPSEHDDVKDWWDERLGYEGAYEEQVLRVRP